jgi:hypothetical protein
MKPLQASRRGRKWWNVSFCFAALWFAAAPLTTTTKILVDTFFCSSDDDDGLQSSAMRKMNSILIDSLETLGFQLSATRNARALWPASFDHTLRLFEEANVGAEDLQALLNRIEVKSKNNSLAKLMCRSPGQANFTRSL